MSFMKEVMYCVTIATRQSQVGPALKRPLHHNLQHDQQVTLPDRGGSAGQTAASQRDDDERRQHQSRDGRQSDEEEEAWRKTEKS